MNINVFKRISNAFYLPFVLGYDLLQTQFNHYDIPCDVALEYCLNLYATYSVSIEAQQDKSEYECLQDYVNNNMHEIESEIIELAKKYSSISDKKEKTKPNEIEKLLKYYGCRSISELWDYIDYLEEKKNDLRELKSDIFYLVKEKYN